MLTTLTRGIPSSGTCVPSMATALGQLAAVPPTVVPGCADTGCVSPNLAAAAAAARPADTVVLALGLSASPKIMSSARRGDGGGNRPRPTGTEGEGHDRMDIGLPDGQVALLNATLAAAKPGAGVDVSDASATQKQRPGWNLSHANSFAPRGTKACLDGPGRSSFGLGETKTAPSG